jgi:hypothetical protein
MQVTASGAKPNMTQTSKNFTYNMHRKANSNKLPLIPSSSGKDGNGQQNTAANQYQN